MNPELVTLVGIGLNFIIAYWVKKNGTVLIKKTIPIGNIIIGIVTQWVAAANQQTVAVAPAVALAGFFGTFGKGFLDIVINGLIQALITTGAHSTQKNITEAIKVSAAK